MQSNQSTLSTPSGRTGTSANPSLIQGESSTAPSVVVQSQLATSTIDGKGATRSNLGQVVGDLSAAHSAHSGWQESEIKKISDWGSREIERILAQTKGVESKLIQEAQNKQRVIEETHKGDLSKLVQKLDAEKAMKLKELEDGMQRQIQAALTTSKQDINNIESEMNKRKMEIMAQAQGQTAKDVDRLSSLAVEAKLTPSVTRTVIETNTDTGNVVAVAGGGSISTGGVAQRTIGQGDVKAVPTAGTLTQEADVTVGTINRNDNNKAVGTGAIVNTQSAVNQKSGESLDGGGRATALHSGSGATTTTGSSLNPGESSGADRATVRHPSSGSTGLGTTDKSGVHVDAAYGRPLDKTDPAYNKHDSHKHEGLLSKVKHAITGEPKSSNAHKSRV